jgi:hypothetical protein
MVEFLRPGEQLLETAWAVFCRGRRYQDDWLYVTNQRIYFYPERYGMPDDLREICVGSIDFVYPFNVLGFLPFGMVIVLKSGEPFRFLTFRRERLMAVIRGAVADLDRARAVAEL